MERAFATDSCSASRISDPTRASHLGQPYAPLKHFGVRITGERLIVPLFGPDGTHVGDARFSEINHTFSATRSAVHAMGLYNIHSVLQGGRSPKRQRLIITDDLTWVWHLSHVGYKDVVGVLGSRWTARQSALIQRAVAPDGTILVLSSCNEKSEFWAGRLFVTLGSLFFMQHFPCTAIQDNSVASLQSILSRF